MYLAVRKGDDLLFEVNRDLEARRGLDARQNLGDDIGRKPDGEEAVLQAVVAEDIAESRGDRGAKAIIVQRPHRVLARGAATEIFVSDKNARIAPGLLIERK